MHVAQWAVHTAIKILIGYTLILKCACGRELSIKTVVKITPVLYLALWLAFIFLTGICNDIKGKGIQEEKVHDIIALKVRGKISTEELQASGRRLEIQLGVPVLYDSLFSKYRMIVIGPPLRANYISIAAKTLRKIDPAVKLVRFPVFKTSEGIKIPTGELLVQFKPEVSDQKAKCIISTLKLSIIKAESQDPRGFYMLSEPNDDLNRLSNAITLLNKSALTEYAELNYLQQASR